MNIFSRHIYQIMNLCYLRAFESLDKNETYDRNVKENILLLNDQFIRFIS
jgi:hypothetical protein